MGQPLYLRARAAFLALSLAACASAPSRSPAPAPSPSTAPAPSIPLLDLQGHAHDLHSLATGRPTLVSLFATWCESCAQEFSPLNRLHDRTHTTGGLILAVAIGETAEQVAPFAKQKNLRYPIYLDPDFALADALGSRQVPTTLVLDRDGHIVHRGALFDPAALAVYRALLETRE